MDRNTSWSVSAGNVLLAFLRGDSLGGVFDGVEPDEMTSAARYHKVLTPLAGWIEADPSAPALWRRWAAMVSLSAGRDRANLLGALTKTVGLLQGAGVDPVVLKGPSLELPGPRDMGDADLLIRPDQLGPCIEVLEASGYEYQGYDRNQYIRRSEYRNWAQLARWSNQFEFTEPESGTLIELHTALFETERVYDEDLRPLRDALPSFVADAVTDPATGFRYLNLEDRIVLLALHCGLKRCPRNRNFIFRQLVDFQGLVAAGPVWTRVVSRAQAVGCLHHLLLLFQLAAAFQSGTVSGSVVQTVAQALSPAHRWLVGLHLGCLRIRGGYNGPQIFLYTLVSPFLLKARAAARWRAALLVPLLVVPPHELSVIYPVSPRSPWRWAFYLCEPFRFVARMVRFVLRTARRVR